MTTTEFDLSDINAVRAELITSVTMESIHTGLTAQTRPERIRSASRIAFLASRIAWMEATAAETEERALELAAWSVEPR